MTVIRIVEAYVGEYASGKSEVAVNRALELLSTREPVTLVDLDMVEPCYTLRPIQQELSARGLSVIAWETKNTVGLGEAGNILKADAKWALMRPGHIVFDVGYGVGGSRTLTLVERVDREPAFQILAVINASRPTTMTVEGIIEYVGQLGPVNGLINNTHLGEETTVDVVQDGARMVFEAGEKLGIPVVATTAVAEVATAIGAHDATGNPVRPLKRFMPRSFW
ncbi:MAG: hypothetical protein IBX71_09850 [Candidatus Desulforudis sp.]|nr:hypothetical protein [Desulforudis sp.]